MGWSWGWLLIAGCWSLTGCAAPQYALRGTPVPDESIAAIQIERAVSAEQAKEFERLGARRMMAAERLQGFDVQAIVERLSRVTERPSLAYRAFLYQDADPNAAALADGRIYLSSGLLKYLAGRGSRTDELAFVLGHELAHTVAQHLVKRYRALQQQELIIALVSAGASAITREASSGVQQAGQLALDAASLLRDVHNSGFSQEQELEADQLGARYLMRAGFDPRAALPLLEDFERFDSPSPFLRTHPYLATRRVHLQRYLQEQGLLAAGPAPMLSPSTDRAAARIKNLRDAQKLYPVGSVSWQNLQREIERLEAGTTRR